MTHPNRLVFVALFALGCDGAAPAFHTIDVPPDVGPLPDGGVTPPSNADAVLYGQSTTQQFGDQGLLFADLDGDGLDDLVMANRANDGSTTPYRGGSVVVFYGRRARLSG